jgi:hypothetical protein
MLRDLEELLAKLKGRSVSVSPSDRYPEPGQASVYLDFADGSKLRANYWRVTKDGRASVSSFDHEQQYGLPAPINAIAELKALLQGRTVAAATWDSESGDLLFRFDDTIKVRVLNFTAYEVWEIRFPDGTTEYSNHAR